MFKNYILIFLSLMFFVHCKKKEPSFPELQITAADLTGQQTSEISVSTAEGAVYSWQVPPHVSIVSGQGSWKIKVYVDPLFSSGNICVTVTTKHNSKQVCKNLRNSDNTLNSANLKFIGKVANGRQNPFIFPLDNKLFFGAGSDTNSFKLKDFYSVDLSTKFVSALASDGPMLKGRGAGTYFSNNNKGYFGFGALEGFLEYGNDLWAFDYQAMTWEQKASNSALMLENSKNFIINEKVYVCGGSDLFSSTEVWEYDLNENTWQKKKDLLYDCGAGCLAFSYNNTGYFISGLIGSAHGGWILTYDPLADEWTNFSDFPGPDRWNAFGFLLGSKYYYGGGEDNTKTYSDIWEWNIIENVWTQKKDLPFSIKNCSYCSYNGKGYLFGGKGVANKVTYYRNDVYEYSPD